MKPAALFLPLILMAYFFNSCIKQPTGCGCTPPPTGIYGQKNGVFWRALSITDTSHYDTIRLYAKTDSDMLKFKFIKASQLHIKEVPKGYEATYSRTTAKGKLTYILDNAANNDIMVSYGSGEKAGHIPNIWVFSDFNLTFKLATPTGNTIFDNTRIVFYKGTIGYGLQN